jgi:hypothetical protein
MHGATRETSDGSAGAALNPKAIAFLENTCVFCQPWWLEAVSPRQWDVAVVRRGEEVAAVWPYAYKVRLGRYRLIEIPELTFYLGPWLRPSTAKYTRQLAEEKDLMTELVQALPEFASFQQFLHPSVTNWLPLYWKGFAQTTRYTYRYDDTSDPEALWSGVKENVRRAVRKAQKQLRTVHVEEPRRFLELQRATFSRQGMALPFGEETFLRLDAECARRGVRRILCAVDAQDRVHAGVSLVWDGSSVYALLRASDPELRGSGAASFILWKAIEFASCEGKAFDFVGSWVEPIERFVRGFGGRQIPFFEITRMNSAVVATYRRLWRWAHWEP